MCFLVNTIFNYAYLNGLINGLYFYTDTYLSLGRFYLLSNNGFIYLLDPWFYCLINGNYLLFTTTGYELVVLLLYVVNCNIIRLQLICRFRIVSFCNFLCINCELTSNFLNSATCKDNSCIGIMVRMP